VAVVDLDSEVHELTQDEALALLDRQARKYPHVSAEEFVRKYDAGEYDDRADSSEVQRVAMFILAAR